MIKELFSFIIIIVITIMAFSSVLNILYGNIDSYTDLFTTNKTLFSSWLGGFSFESLDSGSSIILAIYLLISNVILLNLLIAILSNTYNQILERSNMEYVFFNNLFIIFNIIINIKLGDDSLFRLFRIKIQ